MAVHFYSSRSHRGKVKIFVRILINVLEKSRDIWRPEQNFAGHRETALQNQQNRECPRKPVKDGTPCTVLDRPAGRREDPVGNRIILGYYTAL
jgi:hypothetical protein